MTDLHTSVRELVEFLLRSGDLDNRSAGASEDAMLAGSRMHRQLQEEEGDEYRAEVPLRLVWQYSGEPSGLLVTIDGRADGVFPDAEAPLVVDEIKTTYRSLRSIREPEPVHLAQAKCYAYILAAQQSLPSVGVRMTYASLSSGRTKRFREVYSFDEVRAWFEDLMDRYRPWALLRCEWERLRTQSIRGLPFPYPYRPGQRELAAAVYRTIVRGRKLFLEAPTGTGKTLSVLYPAVMAVGEGKAAPVFYLTAKSVTRMAAEQALDLLRTPPAGENTTAPRVPVRQEADPALSGAGEDARGVPGQGKGEGEDASGMPGQAEEDGSLPTVGGLRFRSVTLTAKEKICILERPACNPEDCPRAKGHFDRINDAVYDALTHEDALTRPVIEAYAARHEVCPFELGLDLSLFADLVIGDYNYLFDPHAYLRRFFGEGRSADGRMKPVFLIDEAHNLVERGREMYSAELAREEILAVRRKVKELWPQLAGKLSRCSRAMLAIRREIEQPGAQGPAAAGRGSGSAGRRPGPGDRYGTPPGECVIPEDLQPFLDAAQETDLEIGAVLSEERILEQSGRAGADPQRAAKRTALEELLEFYWRIDHFVQTAALADDHYVRYAQVRPDGQFMIKLFCADPSVRLRSCMDRGQASILFSATLLPITYYKSLLGGTAEDYEIYTQSVFDPARLGVFIVRDLTSRYTQRSEQMYARIADCIRSVLSQRHGNYLVFFPSYAFLEETARQLLPIDGEFLRQTPGMREEEREAFLARFSEVHDDRSLAGLCVMGGIFGEGIDLKNDTLIGVIVVGTGLPQVSAERELLRGYFDTETANGYDYAYRFPGMNRVQQAAGRVIRTAEDVGIAVLIDERFAFPSARRLFPREWREVCVTDSRGVAHEVERFWDSWL